jgi:hypothetical protein
VRVTAVMAPQATINDSVLVDRRVLGNDHGLI